MYMIFRLQIVYLQTAVSHQMRLVTQLLKTVALLIKKRQLLFVIAPMGGPGPQQIYPVRLVGHGHHIRAVQVYTLPTGAQLVIFFYFRFSVVSFGYRGISYCHVANVESSSSILEDT